MSCFIEDRFVGNPHFLQQSAEIHEITGRVILLWSEHVTFHLCRSNKTRHFCNIQSAIEGAAFQMLFLSRKENIGMADQLCQLKTSHITGWERPECVSESTKDIQMVASHRVT